MARRRDRRKRGRHARRARSLAARDFLLAEPAGRSLAIRRQRRLDRRGMTVAVAQDMTSPISPVVVGFDFTHSGGAALQRAVTLAARAPFHVLHVVCVIDPKSPIPSIPSYNGV